MKSPCRTIKSYLIIISKIRNTLLSFAFIIAVFRIYYCCPSDILLLSFAYITAVFRIYYCCHSHLLLLSFAFITAVFRIYYCCPSHILLLSFAYISGIVLLQIETCLINHLRPVSSMSYSCSAIPTINYYFKLGRFITA